MHQAPVCRYPAGLALDPAGCPASCYRLVFSPCFTPSYWLDSRLSPYQLATGTKLLPFLPEPSLNPPYPQTLYIRRARYELTGCVAHVVDEDEAHDVGPEYEGHLVAHVKVRVLWLVLGFGVAACPWSSPWSSLVVSLCLA